MLLLFLRLRCLLLLLHLFVFAYVCVCGRARVGVTCTQEEMAAEMTHVKFAKLNCTTDPAAKKIAMAQGIKALPTFHLFKNGEKAATFVGGKPQQLRKFLEEHTA